MLRRVKTPCIGVCSTGIGDNVCRGCKRFSHEVIDWNAYSEDQRFMIDQRLELFLTQVVKLRLEVFDSNLLFSQLKGQGVRFSEHQNAYCWVASLLQAGAAQITDPEEYGFRLRSEWRGHCLRKLREDIDREFFALSQAHYDRYVAPGLRVDAQKTA